jgi:hypothetical protein
MVGSVVALLYPGINVAAALDLPFVDVRDMAERFELLGDPERPVAVGGSVADENIGHRFAPIRMIAAGTSWLPVGRPSCRLVACLVREGGEVSFTNSANTENVRSSRKEQTLGNSGLIRRCAGSVK